jgi:hypothetical protein
MGTLLCCIAFIATLSLGRRSLGLGLGAVFTAGYFYGILRANYLDGATHFVFDVAVLGLYLSQFASGRPNPVHASRSRELMQWFWPLFVWPIVMFLVPQRHILIQFVGLRAAIYFLPFLILGARVTGRDLDQLSRVLTVLNLIVFGFAAAEFVLGIERFYPVNAVTEIIYLSHDTAGGNYRIPGTFPNAHSYAGTMVSTLPFVFGRWLNPATPRPEKFFAVAAIVASVLAIFMAAARSPVVILFLELSILAISLKLPPRAIAAFIFVGLIVGYFVEGSERLQRFMTLADTDYVVDRVGGSLNMGFFDMLLAYPMGAGLGSGVGTSVPFFLRDLAGTPIGLENEYGRIAVEQSPIGLFIWLGFIAWTVTRKWTPVAPEWVVTTRISRIFVTVMWATAFIGTGMLTAIPATALLLLQMGILGRSRVLALPEPSQHSPGPPANVSRAR